MPAPNPSKKTSTPSKLPYSAKRQNTSILNFFQKTDAPVSRQQRITQFASRGSRSDTATAGSFGIAGRRSDGGKGRGIGKGSETGTNTGTGGLFLEDESENGNENDLEFGTGFVDDDPRDEEDMGSTNDETFMTTFDEDGTPVKRRRGNGNENGDSEQDRPDKEGNDTQPTTKPVPKARQSGPFIDESDSEGEDLSPFREVEEDSTTPATSAHRIHSPRPVHVDVPPSLVREATSNVDHDDDEYTGFDDADATEFREEEFLEPLVDEERLDIPESNDALDYSGHESGVGVCPICETSLPGSNEREVSVHVNNCLDGLSGSVSEGQGKEKGLSRAERDAIPRPAQPDPFASDAPRKTSAFSKLMAGNAEDTAWAAAAAKEVASRGKQAYQRTCPFYKIIPGFSICMDAFRYGAVEGCNAYFLSHFHSDHYMGLTAKWCHGPIYCSKITGNLVRQQLKVDPKWIVDLEFEKTTEVPDTGGVKVTLIEANHCPGSALFLFEKPGPSLSSKAQRVLHCGDFRASPAHAQHPLLRPETFDPVTGQRKYQKIDVCYLDTTYLSPKYSFPSQDDVVQACAELCVSLSQDDGTGQAPWEKGNGQAGNMNKFFSPATGTGRHTAPSRLGRLLVVIGTYSIGKERICLAIARALHSKIYATAAKKRVCDCLEDAELSSILTDDPLDAQVHMQTMLEIRAETLSDYLHSMQPSFARVVGFRPTGWTYRPPAGRAEANPSVSTVLYSEQWQTGFSERDLMPQRGSTRESACFGVPYSEHSSFRELTMFSCALRIGRIIPTVNVGSAKSRERMRGWIERWEGERRRGEYRWAT